MTFISSITFILPTFLASTFFTLLAKKIAPKFGFIDVPDADRKRHAAPTPVMGGIGMAMGLITGLPITLLLSATARSIWEMHEIFFIAFVVTALMYCCLGAIDDRFGLRPITKLIGQITCAIPFLFFFPAIAEINLFEATLSTSALTPVICLVWIIFLVNAFNLMDGSDGLAGTLAIVTLLSSSVLALSHSNMYGLILSVSTTGMILGFLVFNLPPAKIFMGDAGSMMIGFMVAVLTLTASVNTENQLSAPVPLLLLGVPFLDTSLAFLRRFLKGKSWRDADREHVHHRLLDRGLSPSELLIALGSVSLLFAAVGVFLGGQQSDVSVLFFATLTFAVLVSTRVIGEVEMSLVKKIFFPQKNLDQSNTINDLLISDIGQYEELQANLKSLDIGTFELWQISLTSPLTGIESSKNVFVVALLDHKNSVAAEAQINNTVIDWLGAEVLSRVDRPYKVHKFPDSLSNGRLKRAA